ncbi:apolipoprotein N-acyltransferase [Mycobacteroides abscessus]|uniref:apolipoprotein N-acyltransferase n=1 Tax=Mycobacteroides abscessus TaxID=36809 RepID=UPI0002E5640B|nr:apolipoprotein N-acyltransferase [Mycobacteroides abscessus]SKI23598.1 Possible polyprenol-phosphate-mannose synthase 2 (Ppm2) [Mycobacteroides abscessus subsp. massiliense]SKI60349.1 apolipoprotein N-acyltransferase [Mycobacteroides abscessus subsp. massiliense]SKI92010.1 apolipoprotein N-acyltransferase [Mycobacteroides abscessus subsp. massiliense]SKJ08166.1 apolipoprotein N-acyltransferase [Mycobacteroides abscessus subsp. massiliense]SKM66845.1 Possible polyprenol-phosphate-mannose syn
MADETVEESVAETRGDEVADLDGERTEDSIADETEAPAEAGPSRGKLFAAAVGARAVAFGRAWMRAATRQGAALIAGLALCASFPPWGFWWAAFPALSVLGLVLWSPRTTLRGGLGYGLLFGLAFFIPLLPWTGQLVGAVPWLALSLLCALWVALFGLLAVAVRNLPGWPLWFAAAWSATEWGKASVPFGGFPWGRVAFGQGDSPMLGLARYGGAPLVSFAVALGAFAVTALGIEMYRWWRSPSVGPDGARPMPSVLLPGVCVCLVLFAMAISWQQVRHASHGATDGRTVTVAAVQGNVPRLGLDFNAQRRAVLDYHVKETVLLAQDVKAGKAPAPQFVVWPENSSDIDPIRNADAAEAINEAAQAIGVPILVGGVLRHPDSTPEQPKSINSIIVWDPNTGPGERHDKQIVQPFGEYLPWRSFFAHFSEYADRAGYFVPGDGNGVVTAGGVNIGVATCWEVLFDRALRQSTLNGAEILAVPSNNALFGSAMSEQQLAISKVRAVEHDREVIVVGTTGISAFVSPDGVDAGRTTFFEPAYIDMQVRLHNDLTPATQWGPWVEWALALIAGLAVLASAGLAILHNGGLKRPEPEVEPASPTKET